MMKKSNVIPFPSATERFKKELDEQEKELTFEAAWDDGKTYVIAWEGAERPPFLAFLEALEEEARKTKEINERVEKFCEQIEREDDE